MIAEDADLLATHGLSVPALLAAHDQSHGILEGPPPGLDHTSPGADERPSAQPLNTLIGPYKLLERLGVAARRKERIQSYHDAQETFTRLLESRGRDIGFGGMPEIRRWSSKGLQLVAPLPPDIQNYTAYLAALSVGPANSDAARTFLDLLASADAKAIFAAHGVE